MRQGDHKVEMIHPYCERVAGDRGPSYHIESLVTTSLEFVEKLVFGNVTSWQAPKSTITKLKGVLGGDGTFNLSKIILISSTGEKWVEGNYHDNSGPTDVYFNDKYFKLPLSLDPASRSDSAPARYTKLYPLAKLVKTLQ
jgi:hypothetical protein